MNTIPFGPKNAAEDPLLAQAAGLPQDVAPPRDLWPAIAARLAEAPGRARRRSFSVPAAIAAACLVAAVSALLTWGVMRKPEPVAPAQASHIVPVNYGPNSGLTAQELVARDELLVRLREKFPALRPETRDAIVKNLAVIQAAADQIDAALAKDPASGMLKGMLIGAYRQELQLYSTVVTSSDGLARRT